MAAFRRALRQGSLKFSGDVSKVEGAGKLFGAMVQGGGKKGLCSGGRVSGGMLQVDRISPEAVIKATCRSPRRGMC